MTFFDMNDPTKSAEDKMGNTVGCLCVGGLLLLACVGAVIGFGIHLLLRWVA